MMSKVDLPSLGGKTRSSIEARAIALVTENYLVNLVVHERSETLSRCSTTSIVIWIRLADDGQASVAEFNLNHGWDDSRLLCRENRAAES